MASGPGQPECAGLPPYQLAVLIATNTASSELAYATAGNPTLAQIQAAGLTPPDGVNVIVARLNNAQTNALLAAMGASPTTTVVSNNGNTTTTTSAPTNTGILVLAGVAGLALLLLMRD